MKTWMQKPLAVSPVMQAYSDISVRERLLRDEASAPWLQRKHFRLQSTGFATVGEAACAEFVEHRDKLGAHEASRRPRAPLEVPPGFFKVEVEACMAEAQANA